MAEIDRETFAAAVTDALAARGLSYREAVVAWPTLNVAMLSRASSCQVLSAGNMLAVCRAFDLDPFEFLSASRAAGAPAGRGKACDGRLALPASPEGKAPRKEAVTAIGSRETDGTGKGA